MDATEINAALGQVYALPHGRTRTERLETLAAAAKSGADRALEGRVLLELAQSYTYAGERDLVPVAYGRLLRIYDDHPAELGSMTHSVHWYLKWMTWGMVDNPSIPLSTIDHWFDELDSRYRQRGYSPRPVLALRSELARKIGDSAAAAAWLEAAMAAPRDSMSDCDACERSEWGVTSVHCGDDEGGLAHWQPVLDGDRTCAEEPHRVLAEALLPLVRTGRAAAARGAHLTGYPLVRHTEDLRPSVALHVEFCALTGNEARGLEILAEHASWLTDSGADAGARLAFATGVCVLLRRLVTLRLGDLPLAGATVESVRADLEVEIGALCARYDARNGNGAVSLRTAARLAAEPLLDRLPLGLRSTLPRAGRGPGSVASGDDFSGDRAAEVSKLSELAAARLADTPEEAEAHLREALALGTPVLTMQEAARLGAQLVIAIASQPDRELDLADAAVRAAARWEGLSEPDVLHHTLVAARAFHRAERHGEAVALFEQALVSGALPYPSGELAVVRAQFGRSLNALDRHRDAARQFLEGARLVEHDPERTRLHADLASSAATALEYCGQEAEAVAAYHRAAELWAGLGAVAQRARCLRSAAWLQVFREADPQLWLTSMRALTSELAESAEQSAEAAGELAHTRAQLARMLQIGGITETTA
ncbi:hypothetical protein IU486_08225 [Streptomyces gardneri]|uniref:hypothetical protein n=1 Tax=Nocardia sputi TaxID=2943705 RepID=UPI0018956937|nr:hypothetical protein [Nocardia sputi]MBF6164759.1 hypothetical protein [Streptomyces gardneri]MBF6208467.1 hypothetical protein [Streptomyces gardneri]